ncbi:hypothetical protein B0I37DRAFT_5954 [Chaetomium sp. MPI-CAGE-AT-0009]|nr:hypothetical protein B0I37DRAFT_5954 [Chaetomium sp. MPI-CAGE-AT-0009]
MEVPHARPMSTSPCNMRVRCGRACDPGRRSLPACPTAQQEPSVSRGSPPEDVKGAAGFALPYEYFVHHPISDPTTCRVTHCPSPVSPLPRFSRVGSRAQQKLQCFSGSTDPFGTTLVHVRPRSARPARLSGVPQEPYPMLLKTVSGPGMGGVPVCGRTPAPGLVPPLRAATVHVRAGPDVPLSFWIADAESEAPVCRGVA